MRTLSRFLYSQRQPVLIILGVGLLSIVGFLDYVTGAEYSFTIFYLLPVSLVTWYVGRRAGFSIALVSALVWSLAYISTTQVHWDTLVPYWNLIERLVIFLIVNFTVAAIKSALDREAALARTDYLTGAPNARAFFERMQQEIAYLRRNGRPFTVAYIDMDNFKAINDTLGHSGGDLVLRSVVNTISANIRVTDCACRLAGDEFAVLMPELDKAQSRRVDNACSRETA